MSGRMWTALVLAGLAGAMATLASFAVASGNTVAAIIAAIAALWLGGAAVVVAVKL